METVNRNSFATALYSAETQILYYEYIGMIHIPNGLETLRKAMTFAVTHPIKGIVSDLSKMKGTFTGAHEFFEKEYYPHMIKHGVQCTAIILSNDAFTKFAAADLQKRVGHFQLKMFENFKVGEAWVLEMITTAVAKN